MRNWGPGHPAWPGRQPTPTGPQSPPAPPGAPTPPTSSGVGGGTVGELLTPQPDPVPGGPSVTDALLRWCAFVQASPVLAELLVARREQGVARYGVELTAHNGRSARADATQEAVDLLLYLGQIVAERDHAGLDVRDARRALAEVSTLCVDLCNNPDDWRTT